METLDYLEIADRFNNVWTGNYEEYFYEKAWDILSRQGLTYYNSDAEYVQVILRAGALYLTFGEFSQAAFDETFYVSEVVDFVEGFSEYVDDFDFIIGQLYARKSNRIGYDKKNGIYTLIKAEKSKVISTLKAGFSKYELATVMYAAVEIDQYLDPEKKRYDAIYDVSEIIEPESIDCSDEFWEMLHKHRNRIINKRSQALVKGYNWLNEGAPDIAYYKNEDIE